MSGMFHLAVVRGRSAALSAGSVKIGDLDTAKAAGPGDWKRAGAPSLERVIAGELCTGCGLCAGVSRGAITMALDPAGFARPVPVATVDSETDRIIEAACPGLRLPAWEHAPAAPAHPYWGPFRICATGHATDPETRFSGSSGGLLSALAIHALEAGLVDAIVQLSASEDDPLANRVRVSRTREDILSSAGSRYGPSPVLEEIGALLDRQERFLIIGKPCDISALRLLARIDPRVDRRFPFKLSFFCGGMPSMAGTHAIVSEMGLEGSKLRSFRYRGNGWPGTAAAETADGRRAEMSYARSWGDFLSGRIQYRCKICPDAVGGVADIACADAWYGGETGYPQFDERDGRSLILARTPDGERLIRSALAAGRCVMEPLDPAEIDLMQPSQARRKRLIKARTAAARVLLQPVPHYEGLQLDKAAKRAGWREKTRNFLGSARRILLGHR